MGVASGEIVSLHTIGKAVGHVLLSAILAILSAVVVLITGEGLDQKHKHDKILVQCHACGKYSPK